MAFLVCMKILAPEKNQQVQSSPGAHTLELLLLGDNVMSSGLAPYLTAYTQARGHRGPQREKPLVKCYVTFISLADIYIQMSTLLKSTIFTPDEWETERSAPLLWNLLQAVTASE